MTVILNCWNVYTNHDVQVTVKALRPLVQVVRVACNFVYNCTFNENQMQTNLLQFKNVEEITQRSVRL